MCFMISFSGIYYVSCLNFLYLGNAAATHLGDMHFMLQLVVKSDDFMVDVKTVINTERKTMYMNKKI